MTKTLYLLRHLKSSWDEPGLADHERPLGQRGRKAGKKLARHLRRTGVAPKTGSVLVIAHNPGLADLAVGLAGRGGDEALRRVGEKFPTGAFATLTFGGSWADVEPGSGELVDYVVPRELD